LNKYLKAVSINIIFFTIGSIAFLVLTPVAINVMGEKYFGLWSIIVAIFQFTGIGALGVGLIVNKFASEKTSSDSEVSNIISSSIVIITTTAFATFFIILVIRDVLVKSINPPSVYIDQFKAAMIINGISLFPLFISEIFYGYFLSQLKNKLVKTMGLISSIFPWIGGIIISLYIKNLVWLAVWHLFIEMIILAIFFIAITRSMSLKWAPSITMIRKMLGYSKYFLLESISNSLFQRFSRILVGITLGPVFAGVYFVGTSVGLRLEMISIQITQTMIPFASLKQSEGENEVLYDTFRKLSKYISLMIAGMASLLIVWMNEILSIWISPDYAAAYSPFFIILILAYAFKGLSYPAYQTHIGLGNVKTNSLTYLVFSLTLITLLYYLSRLFGLEGAASANLIMVALLVLNLWTYKNLNRNISWNHVFTDLKLGVLLPLVSFIIVFLHAPPFIRAAYSIILGVFAFVTIKNDEFIMKQLKQLTEKLTRANGRRKP